MALLTELVATIAAIEGLEESFVTGVARYLREAGLISQAGRGRGAAKMSFADGAALLVGVNATTVAKDAPAVVQDFMNFKWEDQRLANGIDEQELRGRSDDLFDWVLQRTDFGHMGRGTLGVFLERLLYSAVPVGGGNSRISDVTQSDDVTFEITFCRTEASVKFRFSYYSVEYDEDGDVSGHEGDIYEVGEFLPASERKRFDGDRYERVTITQKTILEVGRVLAS